MLTVGQPQLTLWDAVLPAELTTLNEELRKVDMFLDDESVEPFKKHFNERIGKPSTPYELGYKLLVEQVRDSIMWRRFCRIPNDGKVLDFTTLIKPVKRCGDTTIKELNKLFIKQAAIGLTRVTKLRTDTTVVESNIHYPTVATLIQDGIGVISKMVKKVKTLGVATATRYNDHSRSARKKLLSTVKVLRRRTKKKQQRKYERSLMRWLNRRSFLEDDPDRIGCGKRTTNASGWSYDRKSGNLP